eukprot:5988036-Karenia_brevis.AAC.1
MLRQILGAGRRRVEQQFLESSQTLQEADSEAGDDHGGNQEQDTADLEPWVDWLRRTTHVAEQAMRRAGVQDWVSQQRGRKWILA